MSRIFGGLSLAIGIGLTHLRNLLAGGAVNNGMAYSDGTSFMLFSNGVDVMLYSGAVNNSMAYSDGTSFMLFSNGVDVMLYSAGD